MCIMFAHPKNIRGLKGNPAELGDQRFYFLCNFCHWDTAVIGYSGQNLQKFLQRLNYYKGLYLKPPQQLVYDKLLELYRLNQDEHIRKEKF